MVRTTHFGSQKVLEVTVHIYSRKGGLPSWSDCFFTGVKKGIFALFLRKGFYGIIVKQKGFIG